MTSKNIFITGASSGIGREIARELASKDSRLFLTARNHDRLSALARELSTERGAAVDFYEADLAKNGAVEAITHWIQEGAQSLDVVVLDAGYYEEGELSSFPVDRMRENLEVNFFVNFLFAESLKGLLLKGKRPRIIIIGSTAAYEAYPLVPTYGVAKWALRGLAINLRAELKSSGIGVTFVSPGPTWTGMWEGEDLPRERLLEPTDIAKMVHASLQLSAQAVVDEIIVRPMLGDIHAD